MKTELLVIALFCWLLACVTGALAGTYSLTTTTAQDEALQFAVDKLNAARAAETPPKPALTIEQYLQHIIDAAIPSYRAQMRQERVFDRLKDQWSTLTTAQKQAVCTQLGVSAGECPR